ncbi:hypothetical protein SUNI508_01453 [Seiridium unicorne]|uniref:Uncharacterized protein n=1 Tax=Seiridium unicorne TaxID=138068 RepID=A0ABR2UTH4_9PEZI
MRGARTGLRGKIGGLDLPRYQSTIRNIEWAPSVAVLEDESLVVYLPISENAAHAVGISRPVLANSHCFTGFASSYLHVFPDFTPHSPRWLVFNDRDDESLAVLKKLKTKRDVDIGVPKLEIASMKEDSRTGRQTKGSWADLTKGDNRRRLDIACGIMSFHQLTGFTFSSSYGPTFYKSVGLGANAYIYALSTTLFRWWLLWRP